MVNKTPHQQIKAIVDRKKYTRRVIAELCGLSYNTFNLYYSQQPERFIERHIENLKKNAKLLKIEL